jgi:hypothetical protein
MSDLHQLSGRLRALVGLSQASSVIPRSRAACALAGLLRFSRHWAAISAAYVTFGSACSSYGHPDFPVNIGIVGIFGVLGALTVNYGRRWLAAIRNRIGRQDH